MGYVKVRLLPFKVLVRPSCKGWRPRIDAEQKLQQLTSERGVGRSHGWARFWRSCQRTSRTSSRPSRSPP